MRPPLESQLFDYIAQYITLTDEERNAIIALNLFRRYPKNTLLLRQGERSNKSYFVLKGCLRCFYLVEGEEKTTEFYTESQSLSPVCAVNNEPSEYYIDCVEDCILSVGTPDIEKDAFEKYPRLQSLCLSISEEKLAENQASYFRFKNSTAEQRYLYLMENRPELLNRVPQHQIASYLGVQPESLSRIRKRLATRRIA